MFSLYSEDQELSFDLQAVLHSLLERVRVEVNIIGKADSQTRNVLCRDAVAGVCCWRKCAERVYCAG